MQPSKDPLLKKFRIALKNAETQHSDNFYGWKISLSYSQSIQSLLLGDPTVGFKSYQEREVNERTYRIDVYVRHGAPMKMGVSTVTIDPVAPLDAQIEQAFQNAMLAENPPWDLPQPSAEAFPDVQTADPSIVEQIAEQHQFLLGEACKKAKTVQSVHINSGELYTNLSSQYLETSTGIEAEMKNSDVYFEIALEKLPLPNDQEVLKYKKAIGIEEADLASFIQETIDETLSIQNTELPQTQSEAVVLVGADTIDEFLHTLLEQLNAESEYRQGPHLKAGDSVFKGEKGTDSDVLTLTLDPTLPMMAMSTPYTNEGLPAQKATMIENDVVQKQMIDSRMGHYLNKDVNSIVGNIVVEPGSQSKADLIASAPQCLEILAFSSLLLSPSTLTWSSEIKLGRLHKDGKTSMIKGGVVSGDLHENFKNFSWSNTRTKKNSMAGPFSSTQGYWGPDAMLIRAGVKIAGQ